MCSVPVGGRGESSRREPCTAAGCLGATFPRAHLSDGALLQARNRRGGKSRIAALVALYLACFRDYRHARLGGANQHKRAGGGARESD